MQGSASLNWSLDASGYKGGNVSFETRRFLTLSQGIDVSGALERGIADEGNVQAALDVLLGAAKNGDASACETGLQMCGDLFFNWHIRGKNLTAREYAAAFLDADTSDTPTAARAAALITAGLASWILGQFERADGEWAEAYRIASEVEADRELCVSAFCRALSLLAVDVEAGLRWTAESIERSRTLGFAWAEGLASAFDGLLHGLTGDVETARTRYSEALEIQRRLGDAEGAGLSLGGLAQLAADAGDLSGALDLLDVLERLLDRRAARHRLQNVLCRGRGVRTEVGDPALVLTHDDHADHARCRPPRRRLAQLGEQ